MDRFYAVVFWLVWIGLPALWVGYTHRNCGRGLTVAAMVVIAPFGLTLALTVFGGPGDWSGEAAIDSWVARCVDLGVPAGYALGILLPLVGFRYRDRRSTEPRHPRRGLPDRVAVEGCSEISPPASA